jgi:hypothetical protein
MTKVSKEDLVEDIKYVKETLGEIKQESYLKYGKYSRAVIKRIFGSWNNMMKELGYEINMHKNVTKEDVYHDMLRLQEEYGKITSVIQREHGKYSQICIDNLFGSFTDMLNEFGFDKNHEARGLSDKELLGRLMDIYNEHGYITSTLINKHSDIPYQTYLLRFGTMSKVYELLGVPNNATTACYFSSVEYEVGIIADYLSENPISEWTCEELRNPYSNALLHVDAYFPKHNLAVEYDGQQHFEYVPFLHYGEVDKWKKQQEIDRVKDTLLISMNIAILRIRYDEPLEIEYIRQHVDELLKSS